jgi:peroxiredoxin Q/BCP
MLAAGMTAPDFCLPDQRGVDVCLRDLGDKWVLLWWYPKASTAG